MSQAKALTGKRILISNDDGIHAPGLAIMEAIAHALCDDVWVVAPEGEQSGAGHSLTLNAPLRLRQISQKKFAVQGTPTDCIIMALDHVLAQDQPDLILSGVNRGMNVGNGVTYSGTIAAAIEGCMFNIPSIAMSQMIRPGSDPHWETADKFGFAVVPKLFDMDWSKGTLININFPPVTPGDVRGVQVTRQGCRQISDLRVEKRADTRNMPYFWIGFSREYHAPEPNTDLAALADNYVSVTPLHLNLTHDSSIKALENVLR